MDNVEQQRELEALVENFSSVANTALEIEEFSARAKTGDRDAGIRVIAALMRVAAVDPGATMCVLDAITRGYLGTEASSLITPPAQSAMLTNLAEPGSLPPAFWTAFWAFINPSSSSPLSGDEVTAQVASLMSHLSESFLERAEAASLAHPGTANAATRSMPPKLTLETLEALPIGSLGNEYYRLIVDNNFHLEVLDRESIGFDNAKPALQYLNLRILQMHDVWHIVGGYRTTILQEVGISAFSLAQFNHNYSAMLITSAAVSAFKNSPEAFGLSMQIISEGWLHGRTTPHFMDIEWENVWHLPVSEIHARFGIKPFTSIFPADLIEQLSNAA